jgi:hypothetical protein
MRTESGDPAPVDLGVSLIAFSAISRLSCRHRRLGWAYGIKTDTTQRRQPGRLSFRGRPSVCRRGPRRPRPSCFASAAICAPPSRETRGESGGEDRGGRRTAWAQRVLAPCLVPITPGDKATRDAPVTAATSR